jgi:hypothetical protein
MAFSKANLYRLGPASNAPFAIWLHTTTDTEATLNTTSYFDAAADVLSVGDIIISNVATGGTRAAFANLVLTNTRDVTAIPAVAGVVDVADGVSLGIASTDTD